MSEFISGLVGGLTGIVLCHPVTTIKTRIQSQSNYSPIRDLKQNGLRSLYIGMSAPLVGMMLEKSVLFASYDKIRQVTQGTPTLCGLLAGVNTTLVVTPFERVMIVAQTQKLTSFSAFQRIVRHDGVASLYRGYSMTLFREVPGYAVYFTVFERMKRDKYNTLLTGSACGVSAWAVIYPSDPIKTVMQDKSVGVRVAIRSIYERGGLMGFYRGLGSALLRAGILHAGVVSGYEASRSLLQINKQ